MPGFRPAPTRRHHRGDRRRRSFARRLRRDHRPLRRGRRSRPRRPPTGERRSGRGAQRGHRAGRGGVCGLPGRRRSTARRRRAGRARRRPSPDRRTGRPAVRLRGDPAVRSSAPQSHRSGSSHGRCPHRRGRRPDGDAAVLVGVLEQGVPPRLPGPDGFPVPAGLLRGLRLVDPGDARPPNVWPSPAGSPWTTEGAVPAV